MKNTIRKMGVIGVFAGMLAAVLAFGITPRSVMAHIDHQVTFSAGLTGAWEDPGPHAPIRLQEDRVRPFICVSITIDPPHGHHLYVDVLNAAGVAVGHYSTRSSSGGVYSIRFPGNRAGWMHWQTTYTLQLEAYIYDEATENSSPHNLGSPVTVNTGTKPADTVANPDSFCRTSTPTPEPEPETPTTPEPETPTTPDPVTPDPVTPDPVTPDPVTPDPEGPTCTYEHRLIGVYGARSGNTHRAEVLVSSKVEGASIEIRAYQGNIGTELDVLDRGGSAVGPDVTLGAANTLRGFRPEGATGRHTVIVKHPTKAAMDNATVALQLRGPDVGFQVVPVPGIEQCTNTATTVE